MIYTSIPSKIVKGETRVITKSVDAAYDGWDLVYTFAGAVKKTITTAVTSTEVNIALNAAFFTDLVAGDYQFQAFLTDGTENILFDQGRMTVLPNLADVAADAAFETRTEAEIFLADIDALLSAKVKNDVVEYTIGMRQLRKYSIAELRELRKDAVQQVNRERRAAAGTGPMTVVPIEFADI